MTDEERAREIGCGWCGDGARGDLLAREILAAISEARADERENCAKVAEGGRCEMPRNHATTEGAGAYVQNETCRSIAAAIRARWSE